jgi:hypothetical protein
MKKIPWSRTDKATGHDMTVGGSVANTRLGLSEDNKPFAALT